MIYTSYNKKEIEIKSSISSLIRDVILSFIAEQNVFLIKVNVFIPRLENRKGINRCPKIQTTLISNLKKEKKLVGVPAITVIEQAPLKKNTISFDFFSVQAAENIEVKYSIFEEKPYVEISDGKRREIWSSGYYSPYKNMENEFLKNRTGVFSAATKTFSSINKWIKSEGLSFDNVIRQWNYIGNILEFTPESESKKQTYQEFNAAREAFFVLNKKDEIYPAATGIGTDFQGIIIDVILAIGSDKDLSKTLQSPVQAEAFDYSQNVLIGDTNKKPPLFSRARLWKPQSCSKSLCFVSGTASIIGENTVDPHDSIKQLNNTLLYIQHLVNTTKSTHNTYTRVRLYIKPGTERDKLELLEKTMYRNFSEQICQIVFADICRDNLMIEVEAEVLTEYSY